MSRATVCPECAAGKHGNCDMTSWDFDADVPVDCFCWMEAHFDDILEVDA